MFISLTVFTNFTFAQSPIWTIQQNLQPRRVYPDSTLKVPVLNTDRTFATNRDSIGQIWMRPDSVKLFARFPGNIIKSLVTEDSLKFGRSYIRNQFAAGQLADYAITGNGSVAKMTASNAVTATYARFYAFSTDPIDTTKQLWTIGLVGAAGGGPIHSGGSLVFRSYTTTGAVLADKMSILRNGAVVIPGTMTVGTGTFTFSAVAINTTGNIGANGSVGAAGGMINGGQVAEWATATVTGDYTVLGTDLYINVNNTADCTITIPAALSATPGKGRVLYIKKTINNAFAVNIVVSGGTQTIDGGASAAISAFNSSLTLHDDGSNWFIY